MEKLIKDAAIPGALAYGGVRVGQMVAPASSMWQLAGGILGGIVGAALGLHFAKKA